MADFEVICGKGREIFEWWPLVLKGEDIEENSHGIQNQDLSKKGGYHPKTPINLPQKNPEKKTIPKSKFKNQDKWHCYLSKQKLYLSTAIDNLDIPNRNIQNLNI
jgi:hypothetical protein